MQTAVDCANARTCDVNYGAAKDFGGTTLSPGVHCVTGAMSVGSPLTLSTPGVYIFRSTGALTSATTITVALGGTATAANTSIFWVPTGTASIGATNTFLGSILDYNAAITLGANTTLNGGRTLSGAAVTLDKNTIAKPTY
jgi:Ice-binding-like